MAVLLPEGEVLRLYAGGDEIDGRNRLYESILRPGGKSDPFLWTYQNRVTQLFANTFLHAPPLCPRSIRRPPRSFLSYTRRARSA